METLDGKIRYNYDPRGNLIETRYDDETTRETRFDAEGRQVWTKDRDGVVTEFNYDELGRVVRTYLPDATPDVQSDTPITETVYDRLGRVVERKIADNDDDDDDTRFTTTKYSYTLGTESTPASQTVTNRVTVDDIVKSYPTTTEFDANGNAVKVTDARGNITRFEYDFVVRLVKTIYPDGLYTQVADVKGKTTRMSNGLRLDCMDQ